MFNQPINKSSMGIRAPTPISYLGSLEKHRTQRIKCEIINVPPISRSKSLLWFLTLTPEVFNTTYHPSTTSYNKLHSISVPRLNTNSNNKIKEIGPSQMVDEMSHNGWDCCNCIHPIWIYGWISSCPSCGHPRCEHCTWA